MKPLDSERLKHLRTAAEVGMRMSALQPHTVQVIPDELASMIEEIMALRRTGAPADAKQLLAEQQELLNEIAAIRRKLAETQSELNRSRGRK